MADVSEVELIAGVEARTLTIVPYDPVWPQRFLVERERISTALTGIRVGVEHIGSTSVPGLAAKDIIDILVTVPDVTAEDEYLGSLLAAGYSLRVREPGHRMVRTVDLDVHIHILQADHANAVAYLEFRDHLRRHAADRQLYEKTKIELVKQDWLDMNAYADAKTEVIAEIRARAQHISVEAARRNCAQK